MVAHTLRFNTVVQALEQHLDEVGAIHTISMSQRLEPPERDWMDDFAQAGGGAILNTGIHLFDLLRFLSGDEVQHVYCETARIFYEELEDSCVATMRLRHSKIHCVLDVARYAGGRSGRIELVGETGQLMGDFDHGYAMIIRGAPRHTARSRPTCADHCQCAQSVCAGAAARRGAADQCRGWLSRCGNRGSVL